MLCCISYYSYIKPQPLVRWSRGIGVVYRTIPTSNHNKNDNCSSVTQLYIVLFLHQTTTSFYFLLHHICCISYYSYIKPQHNIAKTAEMNVVYRTIPTSNHNLWLGRYDCIQVVYRTIPTSNHNMKDINKDWCLVVYRTIPTSNHNLRISWK